MLVAGFVLFAGLKLAGLELLDADRDVDFLGKGGTSSVLELNLSTRSFNDV